MQTNRRQFIAQSAIGGLGLVAAPLLPAGPARAEALARQAAEAPVGASLAHYYRLSPGDSAPREGFGWVRIDLGAVRPIDAIRLRPAETGLVPPLASPIHFCIDCSDDPAFGETRPLVDWRTEHPADPANFLAHFPDAVEARYIQLSAHAEPDVGSAFFPSGLATIEILSSGGTMTVTVRRWQANHRRGLTAGNAL